MNAASLAAAVFLMLPSAALGDELSIQIHPARPLIERTRLGQALNFDLEPVNNGRHTLRLNVIRGAVRDAGGKIVQRLEINDNGGLPSIDTVTTRTWKPGEAHTVFNPFHTLAADIPVGRIDFEFLFKDEAGRDVTEAVTARPVAYSQKTSLILPLRGRLLVWDGHDFYAHHRRWDFSNPAPKKLGVFNNGSRYALDLVVVDGDARAHPGTSESRESYFGYGATVVAPGAGRVIAIANDASNDPAEPTVEQIKANPMKAVYGNYVVIDHGNGEFSQLGHLRQGSVRVREGEWVRQGQALGQVGESGTSLFPHLHYQLVDRPGLDAEGLPARFKGIVRILGAHRQREKESAIDSGDIVETAAGR